MYKEADDIHREKVDPFDQSSYISHKHECIEETHGQSNLPFSFLYLGSH